MAHDSHGSSRYPLSSLPDIRRPGFGRFALPIALIVAVLLVFSVFTASSTVTAGHVGVLLTWGRVEPIALSPGFHFVLPFVPRLLNVYTRGTAVRFKQRQPARQD